MLNPKEALEKHLGRKLTKEEYEIEERKLFDQWTEAIGDLEDDEAYSGEMVEEEVYHDEYTTVFFRHDAGEKIAPEELVSMLNDYEMRIKENYRLQRKDVIYIE